LTLRPLTLQAALQHFPMSQFPFTFPKDSPPVWVFGNLANASQGKTEKPIILGNGDARASFLTFPIPKSPLTYLLSDSATPPEVAQLVVTVDNLEWKQVSSLLTYGPKEQVYIVREDQTGQSYVQFGDGETGSRVPSGTGNISVTYRTGAGAYGPMKPGSSPNAGARVLGLDKISMPDEASGGSQPEEASNARFAAPGKVQSLGRMVSLADYETETRAIPGVATASAAWQMFDNIPIIVITVLMDTGRAAELSAVSDLLHNYNVCRGPQRYPILVRPGVRDYVFCDVSIALAPSFLEQTVFPQVRTALSAQFSTARSFGEKEYRSRIEGVVQNVEGVLWNNVTALGSLGLADDPLQLTLPHPIRSLHETIPCAPNAMLALYPAHLSLSAVAAPTKVC
jgi:predicted phage baseplate assembly protein